MEKAIPDKNKSSLKLKPINSIRIAKETPISPSIANKTNTIGNKSKKETKKEEDFPSKPIRKRGKTIENDQSIILIFGDIKKAESVSNTAKTKEKPRIEFKVSAFSRSGYFARRLCILVRRFSLFRNLEEIGIMGRLL